MFFKKHKKKLILIVRVVIAVIILRYLLSIIPLHNVFAVIKDLKIHYLLFILLLAELSLFQQAARWRNMMSTEGVQLPSVFFYFKLTALGSLFNLVLPTGIGGDAVKSVALGRATNRMGHSMASTFVARILGLFALIFLFWVGVFALINAEKLNSQWYWVMGLFTLALFVMLYLITKLKVISLKWPKLKIVSQMAEEVSHYKHEKKLLIKSFVDSIIIQFLIILSHYLMFVAVGYTIPLSVVLVVFPLVTIATLLPVSIYGIGIRESLSILLYSALTGLSKEVILAATLIGYIVIVFQAIQGALFFVMGNFKNAETT